jgi:predicted alpha/beta hydrolase family esterase
MKLKEQITKDLYRLDDFGIAYRKAKVDLYYSTRCSRKVLSIYESKLVENLAKLQSELKNGQAPKLSKVPWTLVPKAIKPNEFESELIASDPNYLWSEVCREAKDQKEKNETKSGLPEVEFRIMEKLPIDFHVFAALWTLKVGHKFEAKLTESARGNRLRRTKSGKLNKLSLGSTVPYLHPYCKWRDDGIQAMRRALDEDKKVVAITADVRSFYHKLDVSFMCNPDFIKRIGVDLTKEERTLHELFIEALESWAEATPLGTGLPVGLAASGIIANVALFELDEIIESEIAPLYYGRYVDDIILVMENGAKFQSSADVWEWLSKRSNGALQHDAQEKEIRYERTYLRESKIIFANNKNKTFVLSGASGKSLLSSISYEIQMRTSEWRALPDLPRQGDQLESTLLTAIQSNGISADSLRKADKVSVRKAGFALKLRDIEAYARALPPEQWKAQRHAFLNAFTRHILVLPTFFDFFTYLSRVLAIATSNGDFEHLRQMLDALERMLKELKKCSQSIKAQPKKDRFLTKIKIANIFKQQLITRVADSIESAFPLKLSAKEKRLWEQQFEKPHTLYSTSDVKSIRAQHRRYMQRDLAQRPLKQLLLNPRFSGMEKHVMSLKTLSNFHLDTAMALLPQEVIIGMQALSKIAKLPIENTLPTGLLFPTRPSGIQDLYLMHADPFSNQGTQEIAACLLALRGFKPEGTLPARRSKMDTAPIQISLVEKPRRKIRIAVASWKTDLKSWTAAITRQPDPDRYRLDRLNDLLNAVLQSRERPDYLILPELSIPAHWFLAVAAKLQGKGISLISGVEYLHSSGNRVHNQVWAALSHDALGFPATMIYRQDKQTPAPHEETELKRIGNKILKPQLTPWNAPPLIDHGGFQFAMLVCSELTNIQYRAALRGQVDTLFVPQWNQDTESFNALIESAALDIHAYIIQCNDRHYGDSRIRVPHKDSWERDIIRVKGGLEDYFVVGEIDIAALRSFQSCHRSPSKPYKPVPDGFEMSHLRSTLPTAE